MKKNLLLTAALLTFGAAASYGQGLVNANIPFSFRTMSGVRPAGTYDVSWISVNGNVLALRDMRGRATVLGMANLANHTDPLSARPQLVFRCGSESGCALSQIAMGDGLTYQFHTPHIKSSELEHVAVVYLDRDKLSE